MASPFSRFRKNQKLWLAVLALLAMISFVVLPIVMELMSSSPVRDPVVVSTHRYGSLSESRLRALRADRDILRGFFQHLAQVAAEAKDFQAAQMLGSVAHALGSSGEEVVVENWLLVNRADELGIVVSDDEINQFLNSLTTQQHIPQEKVHEVMRNRHISENDLFRMLRNELLAMRMQEMFGVSLAGVTPAQRWDYYRRLNEKARIEVAALPVIDFVGQVKDPDDKTLENFFNRYKNRLYDPSSPEPGFREPQKIALEYFKANVDAVEIPDAEIEKYYEENKDKEFIQETLPEVKKDAPASDAGKAAEKPADAKPAEKKEEAKEEPAKKEEPEKKEEPAKDKTSSLKSRSLFHFASYQEEQKKEEEKPEANEAKPAPAPEAKPEAKKDEPAKPEAKEPAAEKKADEANAAPAPSKYVPLDKVKSQIKARLAERKILEKFGGIQDRMMQYHDALTIYEVHRDDKNSTAKPPEKPDFAALAKENGLEFQSKGLLSPLEVNQLDIGQSTVPPNSPFLRYAFETLPRFRPEMSQEIGGNHFLFWKTDQTTERVPKFTDEGMRDQVLRAWKLVQARGLAEKEAKRLAAEAEASKKPLKEFFADKKDKMKVSESEPFSWMTYGAIPAWWAQSAPQLSRIVAVGQKKDAKADEKDASQPEIVEMPGNGFMREVFRLKKDAVGVVNNQPESVVYIVRMVDRTEPIWQAFVAEDYGRYARVAEQDQRAIAIAWRDGLKAEIGFEWKRDPERDQRHYE